ncbi:MAG: ubiquitin-like domain-containing protein, partial [Gammaproteobacteria bacterium]|nr:ubiquitin-like domain-containing protein [Gammaproteobacteria bacterium]
RASADTVGAVLAQAGISLQGLDKSQPAAEEPLPKDGKIRVVRVSEIITLETEIIILVGGQETLVSSAENLPETWLEEAGISLGKTDRVFVDGEELDPSQPVAYAAQHRVEIHRPVKITLNLDGEKRTFTSTALSVGEALSAADVDLRPEDRLDPQADTVLTADTTVTLLTSREVSIQVGAEILKVRASADTVGAVLAQAGISLQGLDKSQPAAEEPLPKDGKIRVVRVNEVTTLETESIPFDTIFEAQADMNIDTQKITQFGQYGLSASRTRIRYEDGEETARVVETKQVLVEPVTQIEGFGTRITVQTMDSPDGPVEYYRALDFYATSYYPRMTSPPWYGAVACGGKWKPGYVAVDLNYIPCGTRLYVPGYGFAVAMDTAYISGAWIDLGYPDDAYVGWHRHVTVYFLTPIPASVSWVIPPGTLY